mgnify:CR=1 FL=1
MDGTLTDPRKPFDVRLMPSLSKITEKSPDIIRLTWSTKVEIEGNAKPALLAVWIERQYF